MILVAGAKALTADHTDGTDKDKILAESSATRVSKAGASECPRASALTAANPLSICRVAEIKLRVDSPSPANETADMTLKTLKELRDTPRFRPFEMFLSDGVVLTVATPDHLFFMPSSEEVLVVQPDGGFRFVDAGQIVSAGRRGTRAKRS